MPRETLCWGCMRAAGPLEQRCGWARDFTPVPGWDAKACYMQSNRKYGDPILSYFVRGCPLFVPDPPRNVPNYYNYPIDLLMTEGDLK